MSSVTRMKRDRFLTPEEAAKYREELRAIEQEMPDIVRRHREGERGPATWEDIQELLALGRTLHEERERQGLALEEVAKLSDLNIEHLRLIDDGKDANPRLSTLTRYAHALGLRVAMTLAIRPPRRDDSRGASTSASMGVAK